MSQTPYELLARFNDDGTVAGSHIKYLLRVDGRTIESDPIPLSQADKDPAFSSFAEQFAAKTIEENEQLKKQLEEANERIAELLASLPWNPRVMEAKAFVARITASEMLSLASSADPQVQQIVGMLTAWTTNDWPIVLDSPEIQGAIPYLMSVGLVTEARVAELLRDCTKDEAYIADGH